MDLPTSLQELGFSEYEARAYAALVRGGRLNGYEAAKQSGIPRANMYAVLEKLVQRSAARRFETRDGTRYGAVPPEQLLRRLEAGQQRALSAARKALAELAQTQDAAVFNLQGSDEFLDQARALLEAADRELLVAIQPAEAAALAGELRAARARGVAITTLCMEGCAAECGGCQGDIRRCQLVPSGVRWCLLVADGVRMLAAEIRGGDVQAVLTEQPLVVELAAAYIRQSLALATLADDLGERFDGLLSLEARRVLDALHPRQGFLTYWRQAATTSRN